MSGIFSMVMNADSCAFSRVIVLLTSGVMIPMNSFFVYCRDLLGVALIHILQFWSIISMISEYSGVGMKKMMMHLLYSSSRLSNGNDMFANVRRSRYWSNCCILRSLMFFLSTSVLYRSMATISIRSVISTTLNRVVVSIITRLVCDENLISMLVVDMVSNLVSSAKTGGIALSSGSIFFCS